MRMELLKLLLEKSSYQELYTQTAVVVNLAVKFDNPGIQMQVSDEVKSKAEGQGRSHDCGISARKRWTQLSTHCLSEVDLHL